MAPVFADTTEAVRYFGRACTLAYQDGCYLAGRFNSLVRGDTTVSRDYFRQGCSLRQSGSCFELAVAEFRGVRAGDPDDRLPRARAYFEQACEYGAALSCRTIADLLHGGLLNSRAAGDEQRYRDRACALDAQYCTAARVDAPRK